MRAAGPRVRLGVLGCASIAWRRTLPAMAEVPELNLVAVASRDVRKAEKFGAEFDCEAVEGYQRLLDRDDVDAVYVPLPTGQHHEWVARALSAGKHVLAEKPLATSLREATELMALARQNRLLLRENFMFLHHAQHAAVRSLVGKGEIGELRSITAVFGIPPLPPTDVRNQPSLGGGALLDVGVYPLRVAQYLVDGDLTVVGATLRDDPVSRVDVNGSVLLRSTGGVTVHVSFGFDCHYRSAYELWGTDGRIVVDRAFTPPATAVPDIRIEWPDGTVRMALPPDHQFRNIATAFALDVLAGARVDELDAAGAVNRAESVLRQAALVDAVRDAAHGGRCCSRNWKETHRCACCS